MNTSASYQTVVAVLSAEEDRMSLATILTGPHWRVRFMQSLGEFLIAERAPTGVIISDSSLPDGHCWKDVLVETQRMHQPLPLIVADRVADARLWGEVLNLGAYDLLTKPFDAEEVLYAVTTACRHLDHS